MAMPEEVPQDYVQELIEATQELIQCARRRHPMIMRGRDARNLGCEDGTDLSTKDYAWESAVRRCEDAIRVINEYNE